jgi:ABC-2 type transport system permease protein
MSGFTTLLRKDMTEQWRTFRFPALVLVFFLIGLASPLLAKYTPELVELLAGDVEITFPVPTSVQSIEQIVGNLAQVGPIAAIFLAMSVIATEKRRGTAALILTKPVSRGAFVTSKFVAMMITLGTGIVVGCVGGYAYTAMLFEALPVDGYIVFTFLILLSVTVYAAVTFLSSTLLESPLAAAGVGFAVFIVTLAVAALPGIGDYMPVGLYRPAQQIALGEPSTNIVLPAIANMAVIILAIVVAWMSFRRQSL